jgi:hypothetical protein
MDSEYHENLGKKYIVMLIGILLFSALGFYLMPIFYSFTKSHYTRSGIESICDEMFGDTLILDALTPEIMIVSYEYNKK